MNTMYRKKHVGIILATILLSICVGCAKFDSYSDRYEKPQSITDQETLDALNVLKSYVNYQNQPNFHLGVSLGFGDITGNTLLYRMMKEHFDQVDFLDLLNHANYVIGPDSIIVDDFRQALEANDTSGMSVFAGSLVWQKNQNASYLNSLLADSILPGATGSDVIVDFEQNSIGDTYPTTTTAATATVVADPDGKSGNALRMLKNTGNAFPQFKVELPDGRKLGQYKSVVIDFKGGSCCGFYGQGMRLAITSDYGTPAMTGYGGPSTFGIAGDQWGRGLINLPISALNLTSQQKDLTSFILTVGSETGAPDYLIDNITMNWEIPGDTIVKTSAEKATIVHGELERWIKAVALVGKDYVKSWSIIKEPMDDTVPSQLRTGLGLGSIPANTFYWQDYLGKDYAAIAINLLKKYAGSDNKVFFTETGLIENPPKVQGLIDFIKYTEGKGVKVDGIATEFVLNTVVDTAKVENVLSALAASGKLIKISSLDIGINASISQATAELYQEQAKKYNWFVKAYYKLIPADQRAGITFRSPVDRSSSSVWRANEPVGLWTAQNVRKLAYEGVVEGLKSGTNL